MRNLLNRAYDIFSQELSKWFILAGLAALGLSVFIGFLGSMIDLPQEALYFVIAFLFNVAIILGLVIGHYQNKEPLLAVAFIVFLALLVSGDVVGNTSGASILGNAGATYVLNWVFKLLYALALGTFAVCIAIVYLFKVKKVTIVLKGSYLVTLFFAYLSWIFGIVYAATGGGWTNGVIPLFEATSLLMIPGILEELLPGELEEERKETEEEAE